MEVKDSFGAPKFQSPSRCGAKTLTNSGAINQVKIPSFTPELEKKN
jgi:hypothetical protein